MPTYQYSCNDCGRFLEIFQSFSDDSLTVCPECEGRLRKVFNAVGVVFKGSGFYRNDSRSQKNGAESGTSTTTKESSSEKGTSESKPAAKSESSSDKSSGKSSGSSSTSAAAAPA